MYAPSISLAGGLTTRLNVRCCPLLPPTVKIISAGNHSFRICTPHQPCPCTCHRKVSFSAWYREFLRLYTDLLVCSLSWRSRLAISARSCCYSSASIWCMAFRSKRRCSSASAVLDYRVWRYSRAYLIFLLLDFWNGNIRKAQDSYLRRFLIPTAHCTESLNTPSDESTLQNIHDHLEFGWDR